MKFDKVMFVWLAFCLLLGSGAAVFSENDALTCLALGAGVGISPSIILFVLYGLVSLWSKEYPPCPMDSCESTQYEFIEMKHTETGTEFINECKKCRQRYVSKGAAFYLLKDGGKQEIMRKSKIGRWVYSRDVNL